jgi:hypothetical protein
LALFLMMATICIGWVGALRPLVEHPVHIMVALGTTHSRPCPRRSRSPFVMSAQVRERGPPPASRPDVRQRARGVRLAAPSRFEAESSRHPAMGWIRPAAQKLRTIWMRLKGCIFYVLCIIFSYIYEELYVPLWLGRLL